MTLYRQSSTGITTTTENNITPTSYPNVYTTLDRYLIYYLLLPINQPLQQLENMIRIDI